MATEQAVELIRVLRDIHGALTVLGVWAAVVGLCALFRRLR